jgi:hypothetical protein
VSEVRKWQGLQQNNGTIVSGIDDFVAKILTRQQQKEVARMMSCGYNKQAAVRRLLRLGVLARHIDDVETDLIYGTRYALRDECTVGK